MFFATSDKLLPEDTGNNVVVWDAREGGGFPVNVAAPACTTAEACRAASPPTPAVFGAPPSATFSGPGNLAPPPRHRPAVVEPKVTKEDRDMQKGLREEASRGSASRSKEEETQSEKVCTHQAENTIMFKRLPTGLCRSCVSSHLIASPGNG